MIEHPPPDLASCRASLAKAFNELCDILFRSDTRLLRLILASGAICIGAGFAWPTAIFPTPEQLAAGTGRHTYVLMAQLAPEWVWGIAFFSQGSVMLVSLLWHQKNRLLLWLDAAFGVVVWTSAIFACYLAYWRGFDRIMEYRPPAIMGGEFAVMLAAWLLFIRYSLDTHK